MKSYRAIPFTAPLRDVCLTTLPSRQELEGRQRQAEQAAYERGRQDGEKALREELVRQRAELVQLHQGVIESLQRIIPELTEDAEKALIDIALETAQKLVAGMPIKAGLVEAVVRESISQAHDSAEITVHLHPDDLALLRRHQSPLLDGLPETGPVRFISSSEVTRGGCLVHTRFGLLDARRETKLGQIRQSLAS